ASSRSIDSRRPLPILRMSTSLRPVTDATYKVTRESLAAFIHEMNVLKFIDADSTLTAERPHGIDRLNLADLEDPPVEVVDSRPTTTLTPPLRQPDSASNQEATRTPGRSSKLPPPSPRSVLSLGEKPAMEDRSPRTPRSAFEVQPGFSLASPVMTKFPQTLSPRLVLGSIE
ncbi:hypothetical protein PMAYCL1PPCAC_03842, partial [Pristionchus mayeri]